MAEQSAALAPAAAQPPAPPAAPAIPQPQAPPRAPSSRSPRAPTPPARGRRSRGSPAPDDVASRAAAERMTCDDVVAWLARSGVASAAGAFAAHGVDGRALVDVTDDALVDRLVDALGLPAEIARLVAAARERLLGGGGGEGAARKRARVDGGDVELRLLARREVAEMLGDGDFEPVDEGRSTRVRHVRNAALKVWKAQTRGADVAREELLLEVDALLNCRHECVVALLGYIDEPGSLCVALEYCEMGTLRQEVETSKKKARGHAKRYAHNLADAMCYVHSQGYVHCDIKPDNCFLRRCGDDKHVRLKLGDFGHAFRVSDNRKEPRGTEGWSAPELAATRGVGCSPATDIYSFGLVLWYMLEASGDVPSAKTQPPQHFERRWRRLVAMCTAASAKNRPDSGTVLAHTHQLPSARDRPTEHQW
eukprot:m51a1_g14108 hypothetical protein (422) ;mRNA; r:111762-113254